MRLAVTGGRDYRDQQRVDEALDAIHASDPIDTLIHGDANGADSLADDWARRRGIPRDPYPANWDDITTPPVRIRMNRCRKPYNALAGLNRNIRMLTLSAPDLVAVFPGGPGTAHCRAQALRRDIPIMDVDA